MAWTTDETDRLIEGNLKRAYAALPSGRDPQEFFRLLDRLCAALARPQETAPQDGCGYSR